MSVGTQNVKRYRDFSGTKYQQKGRGGTQRVLVKLILSAALLTTFDVSHILGKRGFCAKLEVEQFDLIGACQLKFPSMSLPTSDLPISDINFAFHKTAPH